MMFVEMNIRLSGLDRLIYLFLLLVCSLVLFSCSDTFADEKEAPPELIYHVVQRSFYDSSSDGHGDLQGLRFKLDYLQELGVTSILILPLYESIYYHNYFPINFETIDPSLGSMEDLHALIADIHERGMKIYMDMEVQYVTEDHLWYKDAYGNPTSEYSNFILWDDSLQLEPSSIVYDLKEFEGYDGRSTKLTTINLQDSMLQQYMLNLFKGFMDPQGDGSFKGGVDGFRIDHMMDDLDNKGRLTGLFEGFWKPLIHNLKELKPDLVVMAEQADWTSTGQEYLDVADVDWVFSFGLCFAIRSFDKSQLEAAAEAAFSNLQAGKNQIVFTGNHDIERFASAVNDHPQKLRLGALLGHFIGGIPSLYYGEEIGMRGSGGWSKYGQTDGNEIPVREAFEWYADTSGIGMALWYKDTGPWWDDSLLEPYDGISLEEQKADSASLWHHYRNLSLIRKSNKPLRSGTHIGLPNENDQVYTFLRKSGNQVTLVIANLSDSEQTYRQPISDLEEYSGTTMDSASGVQILYGKPTTADKGELSVQLPAFGASVISWDGE